MMKYPYLSICLLCATYSGGLHATNSLLQGTPINNEVLKSVDGSIRVDIIINFSKRVADFLEKNYSSQPDKTVTIEVLVAQEATLDPVKADALLKKLLVVFTRLVQNDPCFSLFYAIRSAFNDIARSWAIQNNKREGVLYRFIEAWKKPGTEYDILVAHVNSLKDFQELLLDLQKLLSDIIVSLPKSYAVHERNIR